MSRHKAGYFSSKWHIQPIAISFKENDVNLYVALCLNQLTFVRFGYSKKEEYSIQE